MRVPNTAAAQSAIAIAEAIVERSIHCPKRSKEGPARKGRQAKNCTNGAREAGGGAPR
jgi:hypothetical protein